MSNLPKAACAMLQTGVRELIAKDMPIPDSERGGDGLVQSFPRTDRATA